MLILKNNNDIKIKSAALGMDGSYDNKENFKYLQKNKIKSAAIKVSKNSIISSKNNNSRTRNREVYFQIKDLFKWKMKRKYGHRGGGWLKRYFHR